MITVNANIDLNVGLREQIDHNEPGMPWVAHQRYERPDPGYPAEHDDPSPITGSRRVAYGATAEEARDRGLLVAAAYPLGADIPNAVTTGRAPISGWPIADDPSHPRLSP